MNMTTHEWTVVAFLVAILVWFGGFALYVDYTSIHRPRRKHAR